MNGRGLHQPAPAPRRILPWPDPAPGRCGHRPGSPDVDTVDRAASLGLGERPDVTAALPRTVRRGLPDVSVRQARRLPSSARPAHNLLARPAGRPPVPSGPGRNLPTGLGGPVEDTHR